ncbi:ABC transporter substrate-binding protein [Haloarchaeobius iranensis]|uniref:ABC-type Fe3+-hydroxamate transport system, substrate-binding protein n=1 Tax=Haloarchaeobius iranensis TaxID=996166 RepID=A0A1G9YIS4_9EURY|nr:ABC transporter substrate-binding protein [Haloarchaeobius iranensis]SDN08476.1 ABC-type Fe3+-hydroxamate transport system, substrate-binding protein [Haloarchaeobius iranensis]
MTSDCSHDGPTRRDCVKYGSAVLGGGLLAGCLEDGDAPASGTTGTALATTTGTTAEDDSYTARMAPAGGVEFDAVPEDVFTILNHHTDMVLALGRGDAVNAMHAPGYIESLYSKFLARLDGVSIDWTGLYSSWPPTKERLYELDSDVHLADPAKVATAEGWDADDIAEVAENVGPWFGNTLSGSHQEPPGDWADEYEYYDLWEIFARVAEVFQETERYEALAAVRQSMLATVESNRPPESERPSAAQVLFSTSDDGMWGYKLNHPGYYAAHTRPLGAEDALADAVGEGYGDDGRNITLDYELLLEADPDVLLVLGPMSAYHDIAEIRSRLESHAVASQLTAVQEGRVYTQGARRQGPILNLFQTEMAAKQLYPEQFGEWPGYVDGEPYPEIPAEEQLFDRQRVADVIAGEP